MREIKFRGLTKKGEWVYGSLLIGPDYCLILREATGRHIHSIIKAIRGDIAIESTAIRPETVGEYTGLKDKEGREIYEGDLVFVDKLFGWTSARTVCQFGLNIRSMPSDMFEVIGNIHENPELVESDMRYEREYLIDDDAEPISWKRRVLYGLPFVLLALFIGAMAAVKMGG